VTEWRLFDEGTIPAFTTPEWYDGRDNAAHLEDPGHRPRMVRASMMVAQAAYSYGLQSVVDLGAGDGGLLSLLGPMVRAWGYDLSPNAAAHAKLRGVDVRYGDVLSGPVEWGQLAVATEMLEHLIEPQAFVKTIRANCKALVASSPFTETPESHYEFHTWAWDFDGYAAMLRGAGWRILRHEAVGPFQVVLAV
jgi:2-polyprenyl-3-methyl-5-hydroxy-6-metoxy-1,4-benzoquinol methylase